MEKLRIIVGGYIGLYPTGGATWDYIQYPLGLKMLGHDVYYIEDTCQYPVYQNDKNAWNDATACIKYLKDTMDTFEMSDRWAYRDVASGKSFGMSDSKISEICSTADVFINISFSTYIRDEYMKIPKRILIDSDPMFTQIQYEMEVEGLADKNWRTKIMVENHNYLFSFGENIGQEDCRIPVLGYEWIPTRQPICMNLWKSNGFTDSKSLTTIMNWSGRQKLIYNNEEWGQKDVEFEKFKDIPSKFLDLEFEVVINKPKNRERLVELEKLKWKILDPHIVVPDAATYKEFILGSGAEFSVAKETYVKSKSGWFSCRSACYLSAGKPVITQETGWSKFIPSGEGLFSFNSLPTAIDAIERIKSDMKYHSTKAKVIAQEFFDSHKVLDTMLQKLN